MEGLFTERELFLMREAMKAGAYYHDLDQWLDEVISDAGHTVEQSLNFDSVMHSYKVHCEEQKKPQ